MWKKGHIPWNYKDLTGERFGKLVVVGRGDNFRTSIGWECKCDCGNDTTVATISLQKGATKSCGCLRRAKGKNRTKRKLNIDKFNLTQKDLRKLLRYNQFSGIFRWRYKKGRQKKWSIAGSYCKHSGYHTIRINGFLYKSHVLAWLYMKSYFPIDKIDHKDRDRQNTKWNNLRLVNDVCNCRNMGIKVSNTSGVKGVYFSKRRHKWIARITIAYKGLYLGGFVNKRDAVLARWRGEIKYGFTDCYTNSSAYLYLKEKGLINDTK